MGDSSALCCSLFAFPHLTGSAQSPRGAHPPPRLDLHLEKSNPASLLQLFLNFKYKVNSTRSIQRVEFWEYFCLSAGFICMREAAHGGCKTEALWLNPLKYMWRKCYYMLMCVITRALWRDLETSLARWQAMALMPSDCGASTSALLWESTYPSQMSVFNWWCRYENGRPSLGFRSKTEGY